ncbi:uncharacterized protein LOC134687808 [Mytilus trossulus]|uniref:uncharacterized protein LOC134687808 n=1 Tax=Mytilus trossulus TaxID=6551 RepID=UPI0030063270
MQILEEKMDIREKLATAKLNEISHAKKQTETFVQSFQDAQIRDQTRFNKSYQEIVEHFKTQANNETEIYGNHMNSLLRSLSSTIEVFTEAEKKRKSLTELMQRTLQREQKRFNSSYHQIVENFGSNSNKTLHDLIVNLQKGYEEMVRKRDPIAFSAYRTSPLTLQQGRKVIFDKVWTNVGNGYDPITGVFTAPRAGLYHITGLILSNTDGSFYSRLYHNKVVASGSYITGDGYKTGTFDVVFSLQKGDEVYIAGYHGTYYSDMIYSDSEIHVTFSGHSVA